MRLFLSLSLLASLLACGGATVSSDSTVETGASEVSTPPPAPATPPAPPAPNLLSTDILGREPVTQKAQVQHILIAWGDLAPVFRGDIDPRAASRSQTDAETLVADIRDRAVKGEDFTALMKEFSEDPGSAQTGKPYTVAPDQPLVPEFKQLGMRLNVGEVGVVRTQYGWHVIKRGE